MELSQRTALGIPTPRCPGAPATQSSGACFSGIPASWVYSSGQEGARRPQEPGRPRATRPHLFTPAPHQVRWAFGEPVRARGGRRGRGGAGDALACAPTGRLARGAWLSCGPGGPGGALPPPSRPEPGPSLESGSSAPTARFSASISSASSSFPVTRAVTTGSDWPGCPAKQGKRGTRPRGRTSREGGGGREGGAQRRGPGPSLQARGHRSRRGARRGQRAAAPEAARNGTDCPILRQGPGPRINNSPAGPEQQGERRPRSSPQHQPGLPGALRPVLRPGAPSRGRYPGKGLELAGGRRRSAAARAASPPGG